MEAFGAQRPPAATPPDDRWIPIDVHALLETLIEDRERLGLAISAESLRADEQRFAAALGREAFERERKVLRAYAPVDPDRDTVRVDNLSGATTTDEALNPLVEHLFLKAGFDRLGPEAIEQALEVSSPLGLSVKLRPELVERVELWARGLGETTMQVRTWRHPLRGEEIRVEVHRRLAVVFRLRASQSLSLKLFREIPVADVEALLPHAEVRMRPIDQVVVVGGSAGALGGLASKLASIVVYGAAAASNLLWVAVVALTGASLRSFLGWRNAKSRRDSQMSRHLYYQNLASNAGVLRTLSGLALDEDLKEALLVHAFSGSTAHRDTAGPVEPDALGARISAWLRERFDVTVHFDIHDALTTAQRLLREADRAADGTGLGAAPRDSTVATDGRASDVGPAT